MKINLGRFVPFTPTLGALTLFLSTVGPAAADSFTSTGAMANAREYHTATLLPNGKVLVAGGRFGTQSPISSVELYDPANGTWAATGPLGIARVDHTATLLTNGLVLVAGGDVSGGSFTNSAELYDPVAGAWTPTGPLAFARYGHTATLLADGQVLVAGGVTHLNLAYGAESYNPATGIWTTNGALNNGRYYHTATLLANGKVLVAGGFSTNFTLLASAELYDPATGTWTNTGPMNVARYDHTATLLPNGQVLVAGGAVPLTTNMTGPTTSVELYDPNTGIWTVTNSLAFERAGHTANLLPNGQVLVAGGGGLTPGLASAELFDPTSGTWTISSNSLTTGRLIHTATILADGRVLFAGGENSGVTLSRAELYDYTINPTTGTWTSTGSLVNPRVHHTATLLSSGQVLVAGGAGAGFPLPSELYNPATGTWTASAGALAATSHTATLLPNGQVLAAGGGGSSPVPDVFLYNPASGNWTNAAPLNVPRLAHTATLLPNGKTLVAGGATNELGSITTTVEIYDSTANTWAITGTLNFARAAHTATLLANGKVLFAGGIIQSSNTTAVLAATAELYDPVTGIFTNTGSLNSGRDQHTATLLLNGKVLVAGGVDSNGVVLSSAELYDPAMGIWANTGTMTTNRYNHTAVLMSDGKVLVTGGYSIQYQFGSITNADVYDPTTGTWTPTVAMTAPSFRNTETLLPNGQVLVVSGEPGTNVVELFDSGLGFSNAVQPQISTVTSPLGLGGSLALSGAQFRGVSEGSSGGGQGSPGDHPLVQLRSIEGGQSLFLPATSWSATNFSSTTVWGFPPGWALVTTFVNGVPSTASIINISVPVPTPTLLTGAQTLADGSFQFGFMNSPGALFGVLATADLTQPRTNWTLLGGAVEISPGQFRFNDPQATNNPQRFYTIRSL